MKLEFIQGDILALLWWINMTKDRSFPYSIIPISTEHIFRINDIMDNVKECNHSWNELGYIFREVIKKL